MTSSLLLHGRMALCCSPQISSALQVDRLRQLAKRGAFLSQSLPSSSANGVMRSAGNASVASTRPQALAVAGDAPVVKELPKIFDFASEERLYSWWESEGYFKPNLEKGGKPFVISMPPPNVTGALHMGHAMFLTLEDIMTRHWRMRGRPSLWVPGTDHAGIATQLVVEKLLASEGVKRTDIGRQDFSKRLWEWKCKYGGTITNQMRQLGASCDWEREHFTLDDQSSKAVVEAFVRLHEKGLVYRGSYMVNWSPNLQTAVSDLEVEYSEEPGTLFYFKYPVADGTLDNFLPVATTRPETLLGDTAVAVHPLDERYTKYVGKFAVVPMSGGRKIPIIADEYVDREFGTGALKITPGHDPNDYVIGLKAGLPVINILNKDGTLNENGGDYRGLDRFVARKQLWEDLERTGLAIKKEARMQWVPRSQRGGEVVEPLVSKQWFVTMEPLAQKGLQAIENGDLKIIPERFEKIYNQWLTNIKDWCISRQLWWGHRIPVWYVKGVEGAEEQYIVAHSEEGAYARAISIFGDSVKLEQDPDVLDTWFSSGLWPFSTLGWPDASDEDLLRFYPTTVLETGHDILFFWVARLVMLGIELTGKTPFSTVYLHGLVRDSQGRKMSKTLGNVIDPLETIQEYGTDALRFTLATGSTPGQDVSLSLERLNANKSFTNKLWNAGKFILLNLPAPSEADAWNGLIFSNFDDESILHSMPLAERWVVTKLHLLVDAVTTSYERLDFAEGGRAIHNFFYNDFADWYIEASKIRLDKKEDPTTTLWAQRTLVYVFDRVLKLLHPYMPFVTEELWQAMPHEGKALIISSWPERGLPKDMQALQRFEDLQALIRAIRNARAEYSVELSRRIRAVIVASADYKDYLVEEKSVLVGLGKLDPAGLCITANTPNDTHQAVQLVVSDGLKTYLPLAGLVDIATEVQQLSKQATKLQLEYDGNIKTLSSSKLKSEKQTPHLNSAGNQLKEIVKSSGFHHDAGSGGTVTDDDVSSGDFAERNLPVQNGPEPLRKSQVLNEVMTVLNEITKTDDLFSKLAPFEGRILFRDGITIMKMINDKRLCFSFYMWLKQQADFSPDLTSFLTVLRFLLLTNKWDKLILVTQDLFDVGLKLDNGTYCRIIREASLSGKIMVCDWWFQKMKDRGCWPDRTSYNTMIHAYVLARMPEKSFAIFHEMKEMGVEPDINTFCHLLNACQKTGDLGTAHNIFLQMTNYGLTPDLITYSILLDTYGKQGRATEAAALFQEMQEAGVTPDAKAYNSVIYAFGKAGMMDQATSKFNEYRKVEAQCPDRVIFWTMLHLYCKAGLLQQALSVKKMMRVAKMTVDVSCYATLIDGFRRNERWEDAARAFKEMQRYKYPISVGMYEMMMKIYAKAGHHVECERIFDQMIAKGFTNRLDMYEVMINIYKRTNHITNATRIYEQMKRNQCTPNRNICNTMIHIYAKAGMLPACEKIAEEMGSAGIKPNKRTFLTLIRAYSTYGQYFSAMDMYDVMQEAGIKPDYELSELIVEVLLKTGQVQKAEKFLKEIIATGINPNKRMVAAVLRAGGVVELSKPLAISRMLSPD